MPPIVLAVLKYLFLLLIFLFLVRAVRAMLFDISGAPRKQVAKARPVSGALVKKKSPDRVAVRHDGERARIVAIEEELIFGRGEKCHVVLSDSYASQVHARVFRRGDTVLIEDLGSTNGTYLNQRKLTSAIEVARGDVARIGKTEIEFKR